MATRTSTLSSSTIKSALLGPRLTVDPNSVLSAEQRAQLEKLRVTLGLHETVEELISCVSLAAAHHRENDDGSVGYRPIDFSNGLQLHFWFTYLGDTRSGGVFEENSGELTMVLEDHDSAFYACNGTSDELADHLTAQEEGEN
jgi:hypothetical protein